MRNIVCLEGLTSYDFEIVRGLNVNLEEFTSLISHTCVYIVVLICFQKIYMGFHVIFTDYDFF
jgi:hypothetical protein